VAPEQKRSYYLCRVAYVERTYVECMYVCVHTYECLQNGVSKRAATRYLGMCLGMFPQFVPQYVGT
jgi:hypothetical protein